MRDHLLFTLAAPLASFGTIAVGERRPTWDRPSKSQTIGLAAAALGIERAEEERQRALAASLGFAVRIDDPGLLAVDYHTAQAAKEVEIKRWVKKNGPIRTRAGELACDDVKTILSQREFRVGGRYTVALWRTGAAGDGAPPLGVMADALREPAFVPYAGRKAHPLMLPMAPVIVPAETIEEAFQTFDAKRKEKKEARAESLWEFEERHVREARYRTNARKDRDHRPIFADASEIPPEERLARVTRIEERRDVPESRAKWRFGLRSEAVLREVRASPPKGGAQ